MLKLLLEQGESPEREYAAKKLLMLENMDESVLDALGDIDEDTLEAYRKAAEEALKKLNRE